MDQVIWGLLIPFIGTTLGSACVFLIKNEMPVLLNKMLLGFASGVMVAASVWSLLIPAIEKSESYGKLAFIPAAAGFSLGVLFLWSMDKIVPHLHPSEDSPEGIPCHLKRTTMLVFAVTLHNLPEGMAVGVVFAGAMTKNSGITIAGAFALAIGIAIQNFPEGAIISLPLRGEGNGRGKAFLYGTLSGVVEPIGAVITIALTGILTPVLPYLLAFAAGTMIFVVVEELLPEASSGEQADVATLGFAFGFLVMMILDVALG